MTGRPFVKGQSGNPAGRKKGARNKLGEAFIEALNKDFGEHGADAIALCRTLDPAQYLKVIASVLPKQLDIDEESPLGQVIEGMREALGEKLDRIAQRESASDPQS